MIYYQGFLGGSSGKEPSVSAGDIKDEGLIPGSGRSPGEGHGNPLQHSCLENPMDRGAWWAIVHGVAKSRTRMSDFTSLHFTLYRVHSDTFKYTFRHSLIPSVIFCLHLISQNGTVISLIMEH